VGWDAADWKVIEPLVEAGRMPNLAALIDRGVMGHLATLQPMVSPMLWTSIATGKRPAKHGVHGFTEVAPDSGHVRPVSNLSRTTKAIWNILHQQGKTCHVVGWWPSHPAEPLRGAMVSNRFHEATAEPGRPWPLPAGAVHPPSLAAELVGLRVHPLELDGAMVRSFVPRAPAVDQARDRRLVMLAKVLAEAATVHAAATHVLHTRPDWDFAAVYYDAIDHFSHGFMQYHAPRLPWVSEEDFEIYAEVVGRAYAFHDAMLGVLLHLAGDDTTVVLVSDHGFHSDHLRVRHLPNEPAGPVAEHRPLGIFVAAGPGIRADELVFGGTLLDVAPTVLTLFDLPVGRDMDGRPLTSIFEHPPAPRFIDSWDDVPGDAARLDAATATGDSETTATVIRRLADLGYVDDLPEGQRDAIDQTIREERWNLARALVDGGQLEEAVAILTPLWNRWPDESRFGVALLHQQLALGWLVEAQRTFALLGERKEAAMRRAADELRGLFATIRAEQGLPPAGDGPLDAGMDRERLTDPLRRRIHRLSARAGRNERTFAFLEGRLRAAQRRYPEALAALDRVEGVENHQRPDLHLARAEVLAAMRKPLEAAAEFRRALDFDPTNVRARLGLARSALACGDHATAAAAAETVVSLRHDLPQAHLLAGLAHWRAGATVEAERFLRSAIAVQPIFPAGQRVLGQFLARVRGDLSASVAHRRLADEARRLVRKVRSGAVPADRHALEIETLPGAGPQPVPHRPAFTAGFAESVLVVTGLPRSGTSMLMQMLAAGGVPVLTDGRRRADESNPRGYVEYEPVKWLAVNGSWIAKARGKAVKIVSPLLRSLPRDAEAPPYLVVHVHRPLTEVIASQRAMLARSGRPGDGIPTEALVAAFEREIVATRTLLQHLEATGRCRWLEVRYHDALADPVGTAARLAELCGGRLDPAAAAAAVDPALCRSTISPS
jgi:predicted AlkP superfamily phosphohydrolase/phosphomutase/tetratricopeptide (TPR) repeat protein